MSEAEILASYTLVLRIKIRKGPNNNRFDCSIAICMYLYSNLHTFIYTLHLHVYTKLRGRIYETRSSRLTILPRPRWQCNCALWSDLLKIFHKLGRLSILTVSQRSPINDCCWTKSLWNLISIVKYGWKLIENLGFDGIFCEFGWK